MSNVKRENVLSCCCCLNDENLISITEPYDFGGKFEICDTVIADCFRIQPKIGNEYEDNDVDMICKNCIRRLEDAVRLRRQIQSAFDHIQSLIKNCTMENQTYLNLKSEIKNEIESNCCCCFSSDDLFSLLEPYDFNDKVEIYATMISECFQIELRNEFDNSHKKLYMICRNCIYRLREVSHFRFQILSSYSIGDLASKCEVKIEEDFQNGISANTMEDLNNSYHHELDIYRVECTTGTMNQIGEDNYAETRQFRNETSVKTSNFKCDKCNKMYTTKSSLVRHAKNHMDDQKYTEKCVVCDKLFLTKSCVKRHMITHSDSKNFACYICQKTFKTKYGLSFHLKLHSQTGERCDICNRSFPTKSFLERHMISHSNLRNFVCDICDTQFKRKADMRRHIISHMNIMNFVCDVCNKVFKTRTDMIYHVQMVHSQTGERCDVCNKFFPVKSFLRRHMISHSNQRNFICDVCDKPFKRKSDLRRHKNSHNKLVNFVCDVCHKIFRSKNALISHLSLHSDGRMYKPSGII